MKIRFSTIALLTTMLLSATALAEVKNFRFGILRAEAGKYVMDVETTRIPQNLKSTGFRFGVAFDNPDGDAIEWYDVLKLPAKAKQASGDLSEIGSNIFRGKSSKTSEKNLLNQYWFDEGDPLGRYQIEIFVNGVRKHVVTFDVVAP